MSNDLWQPHITVVRGGTNPDDWQQSLRSGASVYHTLRNRYNVLDVHLTQKGEFTLKGRPVALADVLAMSELVFSTLRGSDAARLQEACNQQEVACVGNGHARFGAANPLEQKDMLRKTDMRTIPYWRLVANYDAADDELYGAILKEIRYPVVISPLPDAFSVDAVVVTSETELMEVLQTCFSLKQPVTVSDTYEGNVYAVIVLDEFRGEAPYAFPAFELLHDHEVANMYNHDDGEYRMQENGGAAADVEALAKDAFEQLHLRDIAQVDVLEAPDGELYVLDVNPHPPLDRHSLLVDCAHAVGATMEEVLDGITQQAQQRVDVNEKEEVSLSL